MAVVGVSVLRLTGHTETLSLSENTLPPGPSCGKGSLCNYITLIYGRQRKDGERMETELLGGGPIFGP